MKSDVQTEGLPLPQRLPVPGVIWADLSVTPARLWPARAPGKDSTRAIPQAEDAGTLMCPIYYLFNFDTALSNLLREVQLDSHELKHTQG